MTNRIELSISDRFPFAEGHEFGAVGPYERLVGRAHFAIDPGTPALHGITDLDKAPIDAEGLVQFTGDLSMLKPLDPRRGNRRIFFDYGNRSNKRMLQFFNDAPASNDPRTLAHAGNGFLMRCGYTVAWLAWQGDLLPGNGRMLLDLPIARERHGPTTGPVRVEYLAGPPGITTFPLSGYASTRSHSTVSLDPREARLTRRRDPYDERRAVPPDSWCFARVEGGVGLDNQGAEQAVIPSDTHLHIPEGVRAGLDLRTGLYRPRSTGARVGPCGRARFRELSALCRRRCHRSRQPAAGTGRYGRKGLWLGPFADRTLSARFRLSRIQRRRRRTQSVRRHPAAYGGSRTQNGSTTASPTRTSWMASNTRTTSTRPTASRSPTPRQPITSPDGATRS